MIPTPPHRDLAVPLSVALTALCLALDDLGLAVRFCDEVAVREDGRLTAAGPPETALSPEILRRTSGIEPDLARHEGQPVILPRDVLA